MEGGRQADRQTDRQRHRERQRERQRQRERKTERDRNRETETEREGKDSILPHGYPFQFRQCMYPSILIDYSPKSEETPAKLFTTVLHRILQAPSFDVSYFVHSVRSKRKAFFNNEETVHTKSSTSLKGTNLSKAYFVQQIEEIKI